MGNVVSIEKKLTEKKHTERRNGVVAAAAVAVVGAAALGGLTKLAFDHEPKPQDVMLNCLKSTGEVETNVVVEFTQGTPYYNKPNVIVPNQFDQGNQVGEIKKGSSLRIENFIRCNGTDGDEYVVTVLPTEDGTKPTDLPDFAKRAVAFRFDDRSYIGVAEGKEPTEETVLLGVSGLPEFADQAQDVTH